MARPLMCVSAALVGAALAGTSLVRAQSGRAMTIDDLLAAVRIADPQLSPDGRSVLYMRTTTDWPVAGAMPTSGACRPRVAPAEALIAGERSENTPRWSNDGRRIAFISNRDGHVAGLRRRRRWRRRAPGDGPRDGRPAAAGVLAGRLEGRVRLGRLSGMRGRGVQQEAEGRDREEPGQGAAADAPALASLGRMARERPASRLRGRRRRPGAPWTSRPATSIRRRSSRRTPAIAFSPDGREVAFVSNRDGNDKEAWTTNNDIWIVDAGGGTAKKLTKNPAADTQPVFSPDGRTVFVRAQRRAGFESDRWYSTPTTRRRTRSGRCSRRRTCRSASSRCRRTAPRSGSPPAQDGRDHLFVVPAAGGSAQAGRRGGAISAAASRRRLRRVLEVDA